MSSRLRAEAIDAERVLSAVGATLMDAVRYYLAHARPTGGEKTVAGLVTEFLEAKKNANRKQSYLDIQRYVLENVFAREFGEQKVHEVSPRSVEEWMNEQDWSPRTRLNYFSDIRNLFGFAVRRGYRPTNPMEALEKPIVTEVSPGVLTVDQASALLTACGSGDGLMLVPVAIALFAGLRTEELEHIEWRHIDLHEKNIHVPPEIAKTREGRDVEIHATLHAWLQPIAKRTGKVGPAKSYDYHLSRKARDAGITDWPKNALRHSFASYHFAMYRNAPLTVAMLGHSGGTHTFEKRYRKRVTPTEAKRYWELLPAGAGKVVQIKTAA